MPFLNVFRNCDAMECGLVYFLENMQISIPVPLKSVNIQARIVDFVCEVSVQQEYVNRESNPIEATYFFPVEEEAAVVEFQAEVDGRTIKTVIKEKEEARQEYDAAVRAQKTAFLLEETKPDIFQIKVGHLKPGSAAKVTIKYISELPAEEKGIRLTIPTTIAPRYIPPTDNSEEAKKIAAIPYKFESSAPLKIELTLMTKSKVTSVKSPSHTLKIEEPTQEDGKFIVKASLAGTITDMDRDFIVLVEGEEVNKPVVFLETDDSKGSSAGMVSLVPSFNLKTQKVELIFLIDRSGSMAGSGIQQAKKALDLFLHSMPASCLFNIYSFGSRFDSLFSKSVEYSDDTLEKAKKHANKLDADYGGTEIYHPLEDIFKVPPPRGYLKQIFVLTDGAVSNESQVIALVKKNANQGRLFSLGLGNSCSRHLVKGIARAGDGTAAFAADGEDLRPKVLAQLKNSVQPAISNITVEWLGSLEKDEGLAAKEPEVEKKNTLLGYMKPKTDKEIPLIGQAPLSIPPIFDGSRMLVYRLFSSKETPTGVKVTADTPDGPLSVEVQLEKSSYIDGHFVHQLAARKRIQDLEEASAEQFDADMVKKAIIKLGKDHSLASKHTSFVGVDPKETDKYYYGGMMKMDIANQVPFGFGTLCGGSNDLYSRFSFVKSKGRAVRKKEAEPIAIVSSKDMIFFQPNSMRMMMSDSAISGKEKKKKSSAMSSLFSFGGAPQPQQQSRSAYATDGGGGGRGGLFGSTSSNSSGSVVTDSVPFQSNDSEEEEDECDGMEIETDGISSSKGKTTESITKRLRSASKIESKSSSSSGDPLSEFIGMQKAGGQFKWDKKMETALKMSQKEVEKEAKALGVEMEVWLTALAVKYLKIKMAKDAELWEMVVDKAMAFVEGKVGKEKMEEIMKKAEEEVVRGQ